MPHVSRYPIEKDVYFQIIDGFNWLLTDIKSEATMKLFIYDFFTKTERIMLAKRLAVALMISKGYETNLIKQVLKVSTATVYRIREWVERGGKGLQMGLNKLAHQEKTNQFWKKVNDFLDINLSRSSIRPRIPKG